MRLLVTVSGLVLMSGCGLVVDLGAAPAGRTREAPEAGAPDATEAVADMGEEVSDATDTGAGDERDAGPPQPADLLLYRATDGRALLVSIDASGSPVSPRPLSLAANLATVAVNRDLVLGYDQSKQQAHLYRVDWVTGDVTDRGTVAGAAPYDLSFPVAGDSFMLLLTDYMRRNYAAVFRWSDSTSTFELVKASADSAPWDLGIRAWDDHILLYRARPAPDTYSYWAVYEPTSNSIVGTGFGGDTKQLGPFWEKIAPLGPAGVLAVRGTISTGRAWTDVPGNLAKDVSDLPAPIALLQGTRKGTVLVHRGDSLVVGKLVEKGDGLSFTTLSDTTTGDVAKSWTAMLAVDHP
jgi:hypothetical protein